MNKLVAGIACATAMTLSAKMMTVKSPRAEHALAICSTQGPIKGYLGMSLAYAHRFVRLTTDTKTAFNAGYVYAVPSAQTLDGSFEANANNDANVMVAARDGGGVGASSDYVAWRFIYNGVMPEQWRQGGDVAATKEIMTRALLESDLGNALPNDKAWVSADDRLATSHTTTTLDHGTWGVRIDAGLGFSVLDTLDVVCRLSYMLGIGEDNPGCKKTMAFATQGKIVSFDAADRSRTLSSNLTLESFSYNKGNILSDVSVSVQIQETIGIFGGLDWRPLDLCSFFAYVGAKRYAIELTYSGGYAAYPGTNAIYSDNFLLRDGRNLWLVSQKDVKRVFRSTDWPFTFGGGVRLIFGRHNFILGLEYCTFTANLKTAPIAGRNSTETEDGKGLRVQLDDPHFGHQFTAESFKDGQGIHQFAATSVTNTVSSSLEVSDIVVSTSYTVTI